MRSILAMAMAALLSAQTPAPETLAHWRECLAEGSRLYAAGDFTEAERAMSMAVHYAERFPPLDPRLPTAVHALGFLYHEQSKYPEAIACYLRAIHLWEKIGPSQHDALLQSIDNLIGIYIETQDYRQAKKFADFRLPEMERTATKWEDRAVIFNLKASLAALEHRYPEAESWYGQSLALWEEHRDDRNTATLLLSLSQLYAGVNRWQEALDANLRALAIFDSMDATLRPFVSQALQGVAYALFRLNRLSEAESYYRRALDITRQVYGPDHPFSGQVMLDYSAVLRKLKRKPEAEAMITEARDTLRRSKPARNAVDALEFNPNPNAK
jgi:tetratricopeptide (TPR) repeat protein